MIIVIILVTLLSAQVADAKERHQKTFLGAVKELFDFTPDPEVVKRKEARKRADAAEKLADENEEKEDITKRISRRKSALVYCEDMLIAFMEDYNSCRKEMGLTPEAGITEAISQSRIKAAGVFLTNKDLEDQVKEAYELELKMGELRDALSAAASTCHKELKGEKP